MFSIGERYGDRAVQGSNRIFCICGKFRTQRAKCGFTLSCWKMELGYANSHTKSRVAMPMSNESMRIVVTLDAAITKLHWNPRRHCVISTFIFVVRCIRVAICLYVALSSEDEVIVTELKSHFPPNVEAQNDWNWACFKHDHLLTNIPEYCYSDLQDKDPAYVKFQHFLVFISSSYFRHCTIFWVKSDFMNLFPSEKFTS